MRSRTRPTWNAGSSIAAPSKLPKALGAALGGDHLGRILAGRHRRDPEPHPPVGRDLLGAEHRLLPCRIGVEGEDHLLDHPRQRRHLFCRDRRSHHPDRLLDPRLVQGEDVGVALDDDCPRRLCDRRLGEIDPVEHVALVEELGLGGVDVLGALVGAHRAAAEAEGAAAAVADREHDPGAEAVVLATSSPPLNEADGTELADLEPGALAADEDRVPGARRVSDSEPAQRLLLEAALGEVGARPPRLLGVPEVAGIEGGGAVEQLTERPSLLAAGLGLRVLALALELDPVAVGEQLDRLGEPEPLLLLDELDRVAADPAAEAVVELLLGVDRERRRALLVERAEADPAHPLARRSVWAETTSTMSAACLTRSRLSGEISAMVPRTSSPRARSAR